MIKLFILLAIISFISSLILIYNIKFESRIDGYYMIYTIEVFNEVDFQVFKINRCIKLISY